MPKTLMCEGKCARFTKHWFAQRQYRNYVDLRDESGILRQAVPVSKLIYKCDNCFFPRVFGMEEIEDAGIELEEV